MSPRVLLLAAPVALAASSALAATPDLQAARAALFRLDKAWAQAAAARDLEKTISFWADDARVAFSRRPARSGAAR